MKKLLLALLISSMSLMAQTDEKVEVPYMDFPIKMGEGFNTVQANCLMCHSFGYILNQGKQSKKAWSEKVDKMIVHFKAPITDADKEIIVNYLSTHYGTGE
jgi:cytochrome c5